MVYSGCRLKGGSKQDLGTYRTCVKATLNIHADVLSMALVLNFVQGLHQHPYVMYTSSEVSSESVFMRKLA